MSKFEIYSDGGGMKDSTAAAGCIIRDIDANQEIKIVGYLGSGTNNEAEITAGLIGFAILQLKGASETLWVSDSEYTLKSATQYIHNWQRNGWKTASKSPVKNQGLWKAFLKLSKGIKINMEHVAGHSGHTENEACDSISTWVRHNGETYLDNGETTVSYGAGNLAGGWQLIDLRDFLNGARDEKDPEDLESIMAGALSTVSLTGVEATASKTDGSFAETITTLKEAKKQAIKIKGDPASAAELASQIQKLIDQYKENK